MTAGDSLPVVVFGGGTAKPAPTTDGLYARVADFPSALVTAATSSAAFVILIRSDVMPTRSMQAEAAAAVDHHALNDVTWLLLTSNGTDVQGFEHDAGSYTDRAPLAARVSPRALASTEPAVAIVNVDSLRSLGAHNLDPSALVDTGWARGYGSFYSPYLRFAYNGKYQDRQHRTGGYPRRRPWPAALASVRPEPTFTFGVRTTLLRPAMLERAIASVVAAMAERPGQIIHVTGTVAADGLEAVATDIGARFSEIEVRWTALQPGPIPSRAAGLQAILSDSESDYVWFLDDDDYLEAGALSAVQAGVHTAARPIVVGRSARVHETWADGVLRTAESGAPFDPRLWFNAFTGWNSLPICSIVFPRQVAFERLSQRSLQHDLGEDYALFLLALTAPSQDLVVVDDTIANVSVREGGDNVVTSSDRGDWLLHTASFLSDLTRDELAGMPVPWLLGEAIRSSVPQERVRELQAAAVAEAKAKPAWWKTAFWTVVPDRAHPRVRRSLRSIRKLGAGQSNPDEPQIGSG